MGRSGAARRPTPKRAAAVTAGLLRDQVMGGHWKDVRSFLGRSLGVPGHQGCYMTSIVETSGDMIRSRVRGRWISDEPLGRGH